jgi:hypothetical protein
VLAFFVQIEIPNVLLQKALLSLVFDEFFFSFFFLHCQVTEVVERVIFFYISRLESATLFFLHNFDDNFLDFFFFEDIFSYCHFDFEDLAEVSLSR